MMLRLISVELLKFRRKLLWFLVVLGPLGVVGLQGVNYGLRYDYLVRHLYQDDLWKGLTDNVIFMMVPAMFIGTAIVVSMAAGLEHQMNVWKLTLALPVRKFQVYLAKFLASAILLFVSSSLIILLTAGLGWLLGFPPAPWGHLTAMAYGSYLAILPFIALQTALSVIMANQAVPLTVGIVGMVLSVFAMFFPDYVPYKWPFLGALSDTRLRPAGAGIGLAIALLLAGMAVFQRREVR
jgi:lantibiotic transport system permease protein